MSARKRAIRRQLKARHQDSIRRVSSPEGERKFGAPQGTPITPGMKTRSQVRDEVANRLKAFNRSPKTDPVEWKLHLDAETDKMVRGVKGTRTQELRHQEHVLSDAVEREVDESGHHTTIPAFQADKGVAADTWLTAIRDELAKRKSVEAKELYGTRHENSFGEPSTSAVEGKRLRRRVYDAPETRANRQARADRRSEHITDDIAKVLSNATDKAEESQGREFSDRMRRLDAEAKSRAIRAERDKYKVSTAGDWVADAASDLAESVAVPKDSKVRPAHIKAASDRVAEIAKVRGVPQHQVYDGLLKEPRGVLSPGLRSALIQASGVPYKPRTGLPTDPTAEYRGKANPAGFRRPDNRVTFRSIDDLKGMSVDDLKAYRDGMKIGVHHQDASISAKADAHRLTAENLIADKSRSERARVKNAVSKAASDWGKHERRPAPSAESLAFGLVGEFAREHAEKPKRKRRKKVHGYEEGTNAAQGYVNRSVTK